MNRRHLCIILVIAALFLFTVSPVGAANDPGHDSLYVLRVGDTNITGSVNLTGNVTANNLQWVSLLYGTLLDIRANGTILTPGSRPAIQADANELYIDAITNLRLNTRAGTTGVVQIGPTTGSGITLNVSGTIRQQNVAVCLSNGTNCIAGNNTGNVSSVTAGSGLANSGTAADSILDVNVGTGIEINADAVRISSAAAGSGLTGGGGSALDVQVSDGLTITNDQVIINNASVCRTDGTGCPSSATSGSGWRNTSTLVYLASNTTNVSIGNTTGSIPAIYVDNTNGRVGLGTIRPNQLLDVNGSVNVSGTGNVNIQGGVLSVAGTTTISATRVGTFGTGTTVNGQNVCLADGTNCPGGAGTGWLNNSGSGNVSLAQPNANVSANTLFVDNTNGRVGVRNTTPQALLHVQGVEEVSSTSTPLFVVSPGTSSGAVAVGGLVNITAGKGSLGNDFISPGTGGGVYLKGGQGGNTTGTEGTNSAALGGDVVLIGGTGGDATDSETSGGGGKVLIQGGVGGSGGNSNSPGIVNITGGSAALTGGASVYLSGGNGVGGAAPVIIPSGGLQVKNGNISVTGTTNSSIDGNTFVVDATNNRIGVGTSTPQRILTLQGDSSGSAGTVTSPIGLLLNDTGNADTWDITNAYQSIDFASSDSGIGGGVGVRSRIGVVMDTTAGRGQRLGFYTSATTTTIPLERMSISSAGYVGIGTNSPIAALHVNNSAWTGSLYVQNTSGSSHFFINGSNGRVGVGTAIPAATLDVNASSGQTYALRVRAETSTFGAAVDIAAGNGSASGFAGALTLSAGGGNDAGVSTDGSGGLGGNVTILAGSGGTGDGDGTGGMAGNVIISAGRGGSGSISRPGGNIYLTTGNGLGSNSDGGSMFLTAGNAGGGTGVGGDINLTPGTASTLGYVYITRTGLRVNGSVRVDSSLSTGSFLVQNTTGSSHFFINGNSGQVGINTAAPSRTLDVNGTVNIDTRYSTADSSNPIALTMIGNQTWYYVIPRCANCYVPQAAVGDLVLRGSRAFRITTDGGTSNAFVITNTSRVGINTSTPANTLNVVGDFNVTGAVYGVAPTMYLTSATQDGNHACDDTPSNCCAAGYHMCTAPEVLTGGREIEDSGTGRDATIYNIAGDVDALADTAATDCTGWSTIGGTDDRYQCTIATTITCAVTANVCSGVHPQWCCSD